MKKLAFVYYEAFDGKHFDTEEECLAYEAKNSPKFTMLYFNIIDQEWHQTRSMSNASAFVIPTDEALAEFKIAYKEVYKDSHVGYIKEPGVYLLGSLFCASALYLCDLIELNAARRKLKRLAETVYKKFGQ